MKKEIIVQFVKDDSVHSIAEATGRAGVIIFGLAEEEVMTETQINWKSTARMKPAALHLC